MRTKHKPVKVTRELEDAWARLKNDETSDFAAFARSVRVTPEMLADVRSRLKKQGFEDVDDQTVKRLTEQAYAIGGFFESLEENENT
jgi:hypothetical protein